MTREEWYQELSKPFLTTTTQLKVYSLKELEKIFDDKEYVNFIHFYNKNDNAIIFVNTNVFFYGKLFEGVPLVPGSISLPIKVVPRKNVPNGLVESPSQYMEVFAGDKKLIESIEDLVDYLQKHKQTI